MGERVHSCERLTADERSDPHSRGERRGVGRKLVLVESELFREGGEHEGRRRASHPAAARRRASHEEDVALVNAELGGKERVVKRDRGGCSGNAAPVAGGW